MKSFKAILIMAVLGVTETSFSAVSAEEEGKLGPKFTRGLGFALPEVCPSRGVKRERAESPEVEKRELVQPESLKRSNSEPIEAKAKRLKGGPQLKDILQELRSSKSQPFKKKVLLAKLDGLPYPFRTHEPDSRPLGSKENL